MPFQQIIEAKIVKGRSATALFSVSYARASSGRFRTLVIELVKNAGGGVENFLIHLTI